MLVAFIAVSAVYEKHQFPSENLLQACTELSRNSQLSTKNLQKSGSQLEFATDPAVIA